MYNCDSNTIHKCKPKEIHVWTTLSNANADASSIADENKMGKTSFFTFALVVAFRTCKPRKRKRKYKGKVKAQVPSVPCQHSSAKRKHLHRLCVGRLNAVCTYTCTYACIWAHLGDTPYNGLYGEALPERGTSFRLQVYERVGISIVEVYDRVGKSVI